MSRAWFYDVAQKFPSGKPISVTVDVFEPGTTTPITETIYTAYTGGTTKTNPFTTDEQGEIEFYLDAPKVVDLRYSRDGAVTETHTVSVLSASPAVYSKTLDSTYTTADHGIHAMLSGVFVPSSDKHRVVVNVSSQIDGVAHISRRFHWNQEVDPGTDLLTGEGYATGWMVDGTEDVMIGPGSGNVIAPSHREFVIEGLTPGEPVTWALTESSTGYFERGIEYQAGVPVEIPMTTVGNILIDLAMSVGGDVLYISDFTGDKVIVCEAGNKWSNGGLTTILTTWTGHDGAHGMAHHPTENKLYVSRFNTNEVVEIDTTDGSVLQTFAMGTAPTFIAINSAGTKLYVVCAGNSVKTVTLSGGAVSSAISVGAGAGKPVIAGANLYVPSATNNRIDRISTSSDTNTGNLAAGVAVDALAATPDGTKLYTAEGTARRVREVDVATFAFTGEEVADLQGRPLSISCSPTGKSLIAVGQSNGLSHDWWSIMLPLKGVVYETVAVSGSTYLARAILGPIGDVWAVTSSHASELWHWHCAKSICDPTSVFWGSFAEVLVDGAVAHADD